LYIISVFAKKAKLCYCLITLYFNKNNMSEKLWVNIESVDKTDNKENPIHEIDSNKVSSQLLEIKSEEIKDRLKSFLSAFNNEIKAKTPIEISEFVDKWMKEFFDLQSNILKQAPQQLKKDIITFIENLWQEIKNKSLDWEFSKQELDDVIDTIFIESNQFLKINL